MTDNYYILQDGEQAGPFTGYELMEMGLDVDTMLLPAMSSKWQKASDLPEFNPYFEAKGIYFPTLDNLATFWWRLLAYAIDCVVLYLLINILVMLLVAFGPVENLLTKIQKFDTKDPINQLTLNLIGFALSVVYNTIFEATSMRGSIGKKICKLAVVDADGRRLGIGQAFLRNLYKFISGAALCLGYLNVFWDEHRQGWHDQWARTYVIIKGL